MALAAKQVVAAIVQALAGADVTPAGEAVYASRVHPLDARELPAWRVLVADEDIEALTLDEPALLQHTLGIELQGLVQATQDVDEAMAEMARAAMAALFGSGADTTLGVGVLQLQPAGIKRDMVSEGPATLGRITVRVDAVFFTRAGAPGSIVAAF